MKKIIITILLSVFLSCDNQSSDNTLQTSPNNTSYDYWPTEINNKWNYHFSNSTNSSNYSTLYTIIGNETINNKQYYKFYPINDQNPDFIVGPYLYINKNNGDYFYRIGITQFFDNGSQIGSMEGYEMIILKDYLNENESWSGSYSYASTITGQPNETYQVNYSGTILAKDVTEIINNVTYTNIIKVKITKTITDSTGTITTTQQYWFARNIGIVKQIYSNSQSHDLASYILN